MIAPWSENDFRLFDGECLSRSVVVRIFLTAVKAEGTAENAAKAGGIDIDDVHLSQKYDDYLARVD